MPAVSKSRKKALFANAARNFRVAPMSTDESSDSSSDSCDEEQGPASAPRFEDVIDLEPRLDWMEPDLMEPRLVLDATKLLFLVLTWHTEQRAA